MKYANPLDAIRNSQLPTKMVAEKVVIGKPEEKPCSCLECFSPTFWRAIYGGPLRCAVCDPWPSRSLVGKRWTIYLHSGTVPVWIPCLRPGEHTRDVPAPNNLADQAEALTGWSHEAIEDDLGSWWRFERCDGRVRIGNGIEKVVENEH